VEQSLLRLQKMVERAESLVTQVGMAVKILAGNWDLLGQHMRETENWQKLGARIIAAQEEERRRVAREIHDGPAQALANVALRTELCERLTDVDPAALREELGGLKEMVKDTLHEVRKIIFDLRPMALDDLGLIPALRRYADKLGENGDVIIEIVVHGPERRLPNEKEVVLFRVIQEALQNVYKHAQTHFAMVKVEFLPSRIKAVVEDHGQGFAFDAVTTQQVNAGGKEGFGLMSMRERVELCQGEFEVKTAPGKGTRVEITLPLPPIFSQGRKRR
jgi:two-component system sensor histidine kinase DegS